MGKKLRGRTRNISNYSILTIIVLLFSISGGCVHFRSPQLERNCSPAALLITIDTSKMMPIAGITDQKTGLERYGATKCISAKSLLSDTTIIAIDGILVRFPFSTSQFWKSDDVGTNWTEVTPGTHVIAVRREIWNVHNVNHRDDVRTLCENRVSTVNIEHNKVYLLSTDILHYPRMIKSEGTIDGREFKTNVSTTGLGIEILPHTYDSTTGVATHPTDSGLSFKVLSIKNDCYY